VSSSALTPLIAVWSVLTTSAFGALLNPTWLSESWTNVNEPFGGL